MVAEQEHIEYIQREYKAKKQQYDMIEEILTKAKKQQDYAKEELANLEIDMFGMGVIQ
ncbi:hypothetical protein D3C85_1187140 [compost metagenome]